MTAENTPGSGAKALVAGGTALALVVAVLGWWLTRDAEVTPPAPRTEEAGGKAAEPATPESSDQTSQNKADTKEGTEATQPQNTPAALTPRFDVIRVEPDGSAVIAGQAAPGANVQLLLDGETVGQAEADASGNFVALLTLPPSDAPRVMRLMVNGKTVQSSEQNVIIGPVKAPEAVMAEADATSSSPSAETASEQNREKSGETAQNEAVSPAANDATPQVLLADQDGIKVIQDATPGAETLKLDSISYDDKGAVMIAGRGAAGTRLRVLLDTDPLVETEVGADGQWRVALPDIAPGVYSLRIEMRDRSDALLAQFDTPFKREDPAQIVALATEAQTPAGAAAPKSASKDTASKDKASKDKATDQTQDPATNVGAVAAALADPAQVMKEPATTGDDIPEATSEVAQGGGQQTGPVAAQNGAPAAQPEPNVAVSGDVSAAKDVASKSSVSASPKTAETASEPDAAPVPTPTQPRVSTDTRETTVASVVGEPTGEETTAAASPSAPAPAMSVEAPGAQPPRPRIVTVQPGATLWAIARDNLGKGVMYVQVFDANRDKIRNPDLIYPGQVFTVPVQADPGQN